MKKETVFEVCPHCNKENEFESVPENVFKAKCKHCGEEIMLCNKCYELDGQCDWAQTTTGGKCFRGETNCPCSVKDEFMKFRKDKLHSIRSFIIGSFSDKSDDEIKLYNQMEDALFELLENDGEDKAQILYFTAMAYIALVRFGSIKTTLFTKGAPLFAFSKISKEILERRTVFTLEEFDVEIHKQLETERK